MGKSNKSSRNRGVQEVPTTFEKAVSNLTPEAETKGNRNTCSNTHADFGRYGYGGILLGSPRSDNFMGSGFGDWDDSLDPVFIGSSLSSKDFLFLSADRNIHYWAHRLVLVIAEITSLSNREIRVHLIYNKSRVLSLLKPYMTEKQGYAIPEDVLYEIAWVLVKDFRLYSEEEFNRRRQKYLDFMAGTIAIGIVGH